MSRALKSCENGSEVPTVLEEGDEEEEEEGDKEKEEERKKETLGVLNKMDVIVESEPQL